MVLTFFSHFISTKHQYTFFVYRSAAIGLYPRYALALELLTYQLSRELEAGWFEFTVEGKRISRCVRRLTSPA